MKRKKKLTARQRKLAAMYGDKNKITRGDVIAAAKKGKKRKANHESMKLVITPSQR